MASSLIDKVALGITSKLSNKRVRNNSQGNVPGSVFSLRDEAIKAARRNNASLWFVPDDLSGVYQDSLGATPVTAVGQLIGALWDSARSLSTELIPDPGFDNPAAWTLTQPTSGSVSVSGSALNLYSADGSSANANPGLVLSVGAVYRYEITIDSLTPAGQGIYIYLGGTLGSGGSVSLTAPGTYSGYITAAGTGMLISRSPGTAPSAVISRVSLKRVLGSHAVQSTTANKPTLTKLANGKYAMAFDGAGDFLNTQFMTSGSSTAIACFKSTYNYSSQQIALGAYNSTLNTDRIYIAAFSSYVNAGLGNQAGQAITPMYDTSGTAAVTSIVYDHSTLMARTIGNGIERGSFSGFSTAIPTNPFYIGGLGNGGTGNNFMKGVVSLICLSNNVMPDADRKAIERFGAYLAGVPYYG